jgi:hypothetical protein
MAGGKKTSKQAQGKYASYQANQTWLKNKKLKQARHLKAHPNDVASQTLNTSYGRRDPKSRMWTSTTKELAQLFKQVYGKCDPSVFHANPVISSGAMIKLNSLTVKLPRQGGNLFSIKERVQWK